MSLFAIIALSALSPYRDIPPTMASGPQPPEPVFGNIVTVDYSCRVLSSSGKVQRLVISAKGQESLYGGKPLMVAGMPYIKYPLYSIGIDQSGRFNNLQHLSSSRYSAKDGDISFVDDAGVPKLLVRIDYLYSNQNDRAIMLFIPNPQKTDSIISEAGTCAMSYPKSGSEEPK